MRSLPASLAFGQRRSRDDRPSSPTASLEPVVDHDVGELGLGGQLASRASAAAPRSARGCRCPGRPAAPRSASSDGGAMKTWTASGIVPRTWRAPWISISSTTGAPAGRAARARSAASRSGGPSSSACSTKSPLATALVELRLGEEVVVDAVLLARPRRARGGRHGQLELGHPLGSARISVPLPTPDGPVMTKTCALSRAAMAQTSSVRWRSERPPIVLLGEMRHWLRILLTFTRPYLGTASSMSKTFAVSTHSGGSSSSSWIDVAARLEVALELRAPRPDLVGPLQRFHSLHERSLGCRGVLASGVVVAGGIGRRVYIADAAGQGANRAIRLDLNLRSIRWELAHLRFAICRASAGRPERVRKPALCGEALAALARSGSPRPGRGSSRCRRRRRVAPAASRSRASPPARTPPMPTTGISIRLGDVRDLGQRDRADGGPETPPVPPPSHGSPVRGCSAIPRRVLISETASAPPACGGPGDRARSVALGVSLTISGLAVSGRTRSSSAAGLARIGAHDRARSRRWGTRR